MQDINIVGVFSLIAIPASVVLAIVQARTGSACGWVIELIDDMRDASLLSIMVAGAGILMLANILRPAHPFAAVVLGLISLVIIFGVPMIKRW